MNVCRLLDRSWVRVALFAFLGACFGLAFGLALAATAWLMGFGWRAQLVLLCVCLVVFTIAGVRNNWHYINEPKPKEEGIKDSK